METTWLSYNRRMDTENIVYVYTMVYVYIKNSGSLPLVTTWIDHEGITVNETN